MRKVVEKDDIDSKARKTEIGKRTRKSQKIDKCGNQVKLEIAEPENKAQKLKSLHPKKNLTSKVK